MSTALSVVQDKRAPLDKRVDSVRTLLLANKEKLGRAMAGILSPDRAIMVACNSIRKNPDLLECTPASLFAAIAEAGSYGWTCDGVMGQAYLVPFTNRKRNCKEIVLIPGFRGLRSLVQRSGQMQLTMDSVHEGDEYQYVDRFTKPVHRYGPAPDRRFRALTHAYVVGIDNHGRVLTFSWTVGECLAHRDHYSQGWRRVAEDPVKSKESPWHPENPAFRVMCMKTVLLDAIHRGEFPMSIEERTVALRETTIQQVESAGTVDAEGWLTDEVQETATLEHDNQVAADAPKQEQPPPVTTAETQQPPPGPRPSQEKVEESMRQVQHTFSTLELMSEADACLFASEATNWYTDVEVRQLRCWHAEAIERIKGSRGERSNKRK